MNLSEEKRKQLEKKLNIRIPEKDIKLEGGFNQQLDKVIEDAKKEKPKAADDSEE